MSNLFDLLTTSPITGIKLQQGGGSYGYNVQFPDKLEIDVKRMSVTFPYASGERRDGVGDMLEIGGIDTSRHRKNPICLYDHSKQVTLPIGVTEDPDTKEYTNYIDTVGKVASCETFFYQGLRGDGIPNEHALFCEQLYDLMVQRLIRGGSIGYQVVHARELYPDYEKGIPKGLHLIQTLMLEASVVVMPANMDTVRKALALPQVCGKPLSPMLVKSLCACGVESNPMVTGGFDTHQIRVLYRKKSQPNYYPGDRVDFNNSERGGAQETGEIVRIDNDGAVINAGDPASYEHASQSQIIGQTYNPHEDKKQRRRNQQGQTGQHSIQPGSRIRYEQEWDMAEPGERYEPISISGEGDVNRVDSDMGTYRVEDNPRHVEKHELIGEVGVRGEDKKERTRRAQGQNSLYSGRKWLRKKAFDVNKGDKVTPGTRIRYRHPESQEEQTGEIYRANRGHVGINNDNGSANVIVQEDITDHARPKTKAAHVPGQPIKQGSKVRTQKGDNEIEGYYEGVASTLPSGGQGHYLRGGNNPNPNNEDIKRRRLGTFDTNITDVEPEAEADERMKKPEHGYRTGYDTKSVDKPKAKQGTHVFTRLNSDTERPYQTTMYHGDEHLGDVHHASEGEQEAAISSHAQRMSAEGRPIRVNNKIRHKGWRRKAITPLGEINGPYQESEESRAARRASIPEGRPQPVSDEAYESSGYDLPGSDDGKVWQKWVESGEVEGDDPTPSVQQNAAHHGHSLKGISADDIGRAWELRAKRNRAIRNAEQAGDFPPDPNDKAPEATVTRRRRQYEQEAEQLGQELRQHVQGKQSGKAQRTIRTDVDETLPGVRRYRSEVQGYEGNRRYRLDVTPNRDEHNQTVRETQDLLEGAGHEVEVDDQAKGKGIKAQRTVRTFVDESTPTRRYGHEVLEDGRQVVYKYPEHSRHAANRSAQNQVSFEQSQGHDVEVDDQAKGKNVDAAWGLYRNKVADSQKMEVRRGRKWLKKSTGEGEEVPKRPKHNKIDRGTRIVYQTLGGNVSEGTVTRSPHQESVNGQPLHTRGIHDIDDSGAPRIVIEGQILAQGPSYRKLRELERRKVGGKPKKNTAIRRSSGVYDSPSEAELVDRTPGLTQNEIDEDIGHKSIGISDSEYRKWLKKGGPIRGNERIVVNDSHGTPQYGRADHVTEEGGINATVSRGPYNFTADFRPEAVRGAHQSEMTDEEIENLEPRIAKNLQAQTKARKRGDRVNVPIVGPTESHPATVYEDEDVTDQKMPNQQTQLTKIRPDRNYNESSPDFRTIHPRGSLQNKPKEEKGIKSADESEGEEYKPADSSETERWYRHYHKNPKQFKKDPKKTQHTTIGKKRGNQGGVGVVLDPEPRVRQDVEAVVERPELKRAENREITQIIAKKIVDAFIPKKRQKAMKNADELERIKKETEQSGQQFNDAADNYDVNYGDLEDAENITYSNPATDTREIDEGRGGRRRHYARDVEDAMNNNVQAHNRLHTAEQSRYHKERAISEALDIPMADVDNNTGFTPKPKPISQSKLPEGSRKAPKGPEGYHKGLKNIRQEYRKAPLKRVRKANLGRSVIYVPDDDLLDVKQAALGMGLKCEFIGPGKNSILHRVRLCGDDSAIENMARTFGRKR